MRDRSWLTPEVISQAVSHAMSENDTAAIVESVMESNMAQLMAASHHDLMQQMGMTQDQQAVYYKDLFIQLVTHVAMGMDVALTAVEQQRSSSNGTPG
jgi:hypothetical protein